MSSGEDYFKDLASQKQAEAKKEQEERQQSFDYTPMLWGSFQDSPESKLVRFRDPIMVEKLSDLKITDEKNELLFDKYSGRICDIVQIYNDSGKRKQFFIPTKADEPSHLFWRLRDIVLKREWIADPDSKEGKKKAFYVHQHNHPELVDRFLTNGVNHGISKNKFDKGWKTQQILMANIVDYEMLKTHQERKSWALISKNVNIVKSTIDGQPDAYYYDWGVPSYGFVSQLRDTISHYGALNSYDTFLIRTGNKELPWKIRNANKYREEVDVNLQTLISDKEELTNEQLSWELYDIEDFTKPSSNLKWFKNLKNLLLEIDLKFKTNFHDEMEAKAKIDEAENARKKAEDEKNKPVEEKTVSHTETPKAEIAPTRSRVRTETPTAEDIIKDDSVTWQKLHDLGYKVEEKDFTPEIQSLISHIDDKGIVRWKSDAGSLIPDDVKCYELAPIDEGGFASPDNPVVGFCLACSRKF